MNEFAETLKLTTTPVVLISGVGLILLTLANRLGRAIDRSRDLARQIGEGADTEATAGKRLQLKVIFSRCVYLKNSVLAVVSSIACSSLLILAILVNTLLRLRLVEMCCYALLFAGLVSIVISTFYLFLEVRMTLKALEAEIDYQSSRP